MATIYVDSTWTGSTTGALSTPFNSLLQLTTATVANNDTIALQCGSRFRENWTSSVWDRAGLRIGYYGKGARPQIVGSTLATDWTYLPEYGLYSHTIPGDTGGNVSENGTALTFVPWTTNLATTAPLIPEAGFAYDWNTYTYYVRPGYRIDDLFELSSRTYGIYGYNSTFRTGLYIEAIEVLGQSRHGIWVMNAGALEIVDVVVRQVGGRKEPSFWLGNGIEITRGCGGAVVRDSLIEDIFDSGISPQIYDETPYVLSNITVTRNTIRRCGMAGIEVSTQRADNSHAGGVASYNVCEDIGVNCWAGDRSGTGIVLVSNGGSTTTISGWRVHHNTVRRAKRGFISANTSAGNVYEGNYCFDVFRAFYLSKSVASAGAQVDQIVGNVAERCTDGFYQWGNQAQSATLLNNTFIDCMTGINLPGNVSATVAAKNNVFKGSGTAFSIAAGTFSESYNVVDTTVTPGRTLDPTDQVLDLSRYMHDDGSLRTPFMLDDIPMLNPLGGAGTYVQGVTLRNGRLNPACVPVGAYAEGRY